LLTGGKIELLTSVYFRCRPGSASIDAAGPLMNFALAAIALFALRARDWSATTGAFIALVLAFNAMWGAGYLPYSAVTNLGDWAFIFTDHGVLPAWAWRLLIGIVGVWLYARTMRFVAPYLPSGLPLIAAYVAAVAVVLASVLVNSGPLLPAVREGLLEGAVGPIGILYIAFARRKDASPNSVPVAHAPAHWLWACTLVIVVVFLASMGRGYGAA